MFFSIHDVLCEEEEARSEVTHLAIRRQVADTKVVMSFIRKGARSLADESADLHRGWNILKSARDLKN